MQLIINADDLGYTKANTDGIFYAHQHGIVTSTTVLMNARHTAYALLEATHYPELGIGVHLTLTAGKPLTEPQTLIGADGNFLHQLALRDAAVDLLEVEHEWTAQIERFTRLTDRKLTHLDSHHDVHFDARFFKIAKKLAAKFGVPLRGAYSQIPNVENAFPDPNRITVQNLMAHLENLKTKPNTELFCHPGFSDAELRQLSSYADTRQKEIDVLTNDAIKNIIKNSTFQLTTY
ncbi:hypothetical protein MFLO_07532 [Listeria floridensis FSL S10-1187]|uniref:Carbohydrate deacetylase n=1 Tax=Listeria floridensis FSL S10-1187 TaxID=1265817 RepID=A0ABN0RFH2_9LIST|nr:ChbG/HpnK family deacetylase [Listeria floridensis]EUJ32023.1 hypothetical protein MFLO_07532 [Listeria floridensis FSL S10-1187]